MLLNWLKNLLPHSPTPPIAPPLPTPTNSPLWCVAANIALEISRGPGGTEKRKGTKHFAPGAKVFVYEFFWGTAGERVKVIGRHRKSHRYIRLTLSAKYLANWRSQLVYSPYILKQLRQSSEFATLSENPDRARQRAEEIAASYLKQGAATQPFITRPPSGETKIVNVET